MKELQPVLPAAPPAPWIGGKRRLALRICGILAASAHDAYVEPFIGMGGVFLRRARRPAVEIINDRAGDVANLYRVLQRHPEALLRELRWRPAIRREFDRLQVARPEDLTDVEKAARFLYLQTLAFAGKVQGRTFGVDPSQAHNFDITRLEPRLSHLHARLAGVVIENLDWRDLIVRYDRPGTIFYLDPPYWGSECDYGEDLFGRSDFAALAQALKGLSGRFLLSLNDTPEVRALFSWAEILEVQTRYSIGAVDRGASVAELLISNGLNLAPAAAAPRLF